jgi:fatty-acyl-CoA synthase
MLLEPDDPINIQFTSGTTGSPKPATLTHHNIVTNALSQGMAMGLVDGDRYCMPLPLYHVGGMVRGSMVGMVHGATMVYPGEGFDPLATLHALQDQRCTALGAVPTMFIAMLNHLDFARFDLKHLRKGLIGGAPCPIEVMRQLIDQVGMRELTIVYGMTETLVTTQTTRDDTLEHRVTTVGPVHPHVEIKLVDLEGYTVPRGMQGEICARGQHAGMGYAGTEMVTPPDEATTDPYVIIATLRAERDAALSALAERSTELRFRGSLAHDAGV